MELKGIENFESIINAFQNKKSTISQPYKYWDNSIWKFINVYYFENQNDSFLIYKLLTMIHYLLGNIYENNDSFHDFNSYLESKISSLDLKDGLEMETRNQNIQIIHFMEILANAKMLNSEYVQVNNVEILNFKTDNVTSDKETIDIDFSNNIDKEIININLNTSSNKDNTGNLMKNIEKINIKISNLICDILLDYAKIYLKLIENWKSKYEITLSPSKRRKLNANSNTLQKYHTSFCMVFMFIEKISKVIISHNIEGNSEYTISNCTNLFNIIYSIEDELSQAINEKDNLNLVTMVTILQEGFLELLLQMCVFSREKLYLKGINNFWTLIIRILKKCEFIFTQFDKKIKLSVMGKIIDTLVSEWTFMMKSISEFREEFMSDKYEKLLRLARYFATLIYTTIEFSIKLGSEYLKYAMKSLIPILKQCMWFAHSPTKSIQNKDKFIKIVLPACSGLFQLLSTKNQNLSIESSDYLLSIMLVDSEKDLASLFGSFQLWLILLKNAKTINMKKSIISHLPICLNYFSTMIISHSSYQDDFFIPLSVFSSKLSFDLISLWNTYLIEVMLYPCKNYIFRQLISDLWLFKFQYSDGATRIKIFEILSGILIKYINVILENRLIKVKTVISNELHEISLQNIAIVIGSVSNYIKTNQSTKLYSSIFSKISNKDLDPNYAYVIYNLVNTNLLKKLNIGDSQVKSCIYLIEYLNKVTNGFNENILFSETQTIILFKIISHFLSSLTRVNSSELKNKISMLSETFFNKHSFSKVFISCIVEFFSSCITKFTSAEVFRILRFFKKLDAVDLCPFQIAEFIGNKNFASIRFQSGGINEAFQFIRECIKKLLSSNDSLVKLSGLYAVREFSSYSPHESQLPSLVSQDISNEMVKFVTPLNIEQQRISKVGFNRNYISQSQYSKFIESINNSRISESENSQGDSSWNEHMRLFRQHLNNLKSISEKEGLSTNIGILDQVNSYLISLKSPKC